MRTAQFILAAFVLAGLVWFARADERPAGKSAESPRLDAYGDPLPPGALARFGTTRLRHDAKAVAYLDNNTIVSVGSSIRFWDASTGKLIREHRHEKMAEPQCAAISPDGKRAIIRSDWRIYRVWDIGSGQLIREFKASDNVNQQSDRQIGASADGSRFVALESSVNSGMETSTQATVYSSDPKKKSISLDTGGNFVYACLMSADGSRVVTVTQSSKRNREGMPVLVWWDALTGSRLRSEEADIGTFDEIQFLPGGKTLAIVGGKAIALRTIDGKELWRQTIQSDRFSGSIACASFDRLVFVAALEGGFEARVIDVASGKLLGHWPVPELTIHAAAISPNGQRLVIVNEGRLHVFNLADGKEAVAAPGHSSKIWATAVTPDSRFVASTDGEQNDVLLWDIATGRIAKRFHGHTAGATDIDLSPDGKFLASFSRDSTVRVWESATEREVLKEDFELPMINSIHFLPDNHRLAVATSWSASSNGRSNSYHQVVILNCPGGGVVHEFLTSGTLWETGLIPHTNGRLLDISTTYDINRDREKKFVVTGLDVWDILARRVFRHLDCTSADWTQTPASRDFRTLVVRGGDGSIRFWELSTGQPRLTIKESAVATETFVYRPIAFSPDGLTIAEVTADRMRVDLWDLATGKRFGSVRGHALPISTLDFTPDGRRLLTGSEDTTILSWDMTRPEWRSRPLSSKLTDEDLARHWDRLRNANAEEAYRSKWALAGDPKKAVEFLRTRLPFTPTIKPEQIKSWIADLDAAKYSIREQAQRELQEHFDQTEESIRKALAGPVSAEARNRINRIIEANFATIPQPDQLRDLRAIEVLEQIGTPEAREVLRRLAGSETPTRISRDAAESLKRMETKPR